MGDEYTCIWDFRVRPERQAAFETDYGPDGTWASLFRRAEGYLGTTLLRDRADPLRYVTVDRWQSIEAYQAFRARFSREYDELDRACAGLTSQETALGEFTARRPEIRQASTAGTPTTQD